MGRSTATERGYDARWKQTSLRFRESNPWCCGCLGIGLMREATVVDHIIPHEGDNTRFWCQDNWQPACKWHHNSIKPALEQLWKQGKLPDTALRLNSPQAIKLTRARHRPAIGVDGFAIKNT